MKLWLFNLASRLRDFRCRVWDGSIPGRSHALEYLVRLRSMHESYICMRSESLILFIVGIMYSWFMVELERPKLEVIPERRVSSPIGSNNWEFQCEASLTGDYL